MDCLRKLSMLVVAAFAVAGGRVYGHGSAPLHYKDIDLLTGGYSRTTLGDIAHKISYSIDNDMLEWFREEFGPVPKNHRTLSHGYTLGEAIPKESLSAIEERYGEKAVAAVIQKQQEISGALMREIMGKTGLPREQSRALLKLYSNTHLLGDLMEDNKLVSLIKDFDEIVKSIEDSVGELFGRADPEYVKSFVTDLRKISKIQAPVCDRSERIVQMMGGKRMDGKLKAIFGKTLEQRGIVYDVNKAVARNEVLAKRSADYAKRVILVTDSLSEARVESVVSKAEECMAKNLEVDFKKCTRTTTKNVGKVAIRQGDTVATVSRRAAERNMASLRAIESDLLRKNPSVKSVKYVTGYATRVQSKATGLVRTMIVIPQGIARTAATTAASEFGCAFIISEGITLGSYALDIIDEDEFYEETAKNLILSIASAAAVYVAVALGASPGGPIVMAVAVGAFLIADITYRIIKYANEKEPFTLDDVLGYTVDFIDDAKGALNPPEGDSIINPPEDVSIIDPPSGTSVLTPQRGRTVLDPL